jgi:hypothetical protein
MDSVIENNITLHLADLLNKMMEKWHNIEDTQFTGGKMRASRGDSIESFVEYAINYIGIQLNVDLIAKRGFKDKKKLITNFNNVEICKQHQVDIHIYLSGNFIGVVECKAYLDSCYYVRAMDDFKLFQKFGYKVKNIIFTLEDGMSKNTKTFIDFMNEDIQLTLLYLTDGKRVSSKPIYKSQFKKEINIEILKKFINTIYLLTI